MITKFQLYERLTSNIYHFTYVGKLVNILETNKFYTTPVIGTKADSNINKGKFYYFATQTSRHGKVAYADSLSTWAGKVCINLNGNKLNDNYKSMSVDFWQTSRNPKDHDKQNFMRNLTRYDELEERIVTNKSEIDNARKYIDEIHVFLPEERNDYVAKNFIELKKYSDVNIYFYDDEKYFDNQTKSKSIDINDIDFEKDLDPEENTHKSYNIPLVRVMGIMIMGDDDFKKKLFKWLEKSKYVKNLLKDRNRKFKGTNSELSIDDLFKKIEKSSETDLKHIFTNIFWSGQVDDYWMTDFVNSISADVHNNKSSTNPIARKILHLLTQDMNKNKVKNLRNYFIYKNSLATKK